MRHPYHLHWHSFPAIRVRMGNELPCFRDTVTACPEFRSNGIEIHIF
ncbi:MAG: hypothetical protein ACFFGZ_10175 [Candidatus Thorarchaeota archaeon]